MIRSYSEGLRDVVLPVAHVHVREERKGGRVEADEVGRKQSVEGGFLGGGQRGDKGREGRREVIP